MNFEPIDIRVSLPRSIPQEGIDIAFEAVAADSGASFAVVSSAIRLFGSAVESGMYSRVLFRDAVPTFDCGHTTAGVRGTFAQVWKTSSFDVRAFRIFVNLMRVVSIRQLPLRSIRLCAKTMLEPAVNESALLSEPYPERATPLPFPVLVSRQLAGIKVPCLRVEVGAAFGDAHFARFESALSTWDRVVMRGGYGGDLAELELDDDVNMAETYMASPTMLEHVLHDNVPLAEAFAPLLNVLAWLHARVCPVLAVEIA